MDYFDKGQWVRVTNLGGVEKIGRFDCIKGDTVYCQNILLTYHYSKFTQITSWIPREGEWCWFWSEFEGQVYMNFGKYSKFINGKHEGFGVNGNNYLLSDKVEPFLGELPCIIKEK